MSDFRFTVVVDAQIDFMDPNGALYVPKAEKIIDTMNQYFESLSLENGYFGVLFTADTHDSEKYLESEEASQFPPHCIQGTDGFKFAVNPKMIPEDTSKFILNKSVFNMWSEYDLLVRPYKVEGELIAYGGEQHRDTFFKNLRSSGVDEVEVVGVAADYCVKDAIRGLISNGFEVVLYDNLTAGIDRNIHEVIKDEFADYSVKVL